MKVNDIACDIRIVPKSLKRMLRVQLREFIHVLEDYEVSRTRQRLAVLSNPAPKAKVIRECLDFGRKAA
jgi:hypothetical protein